LVPMNAIGDLNFERERAVFTPEQYQEIADRIAKSI
jgi:hypothetical protein